MAINKNALIRYKTIDHCLQNKYRKWTLEDLIEACSDALYEYEGIDGVSKRTVQSDIQIMRSNKLGYNAPIIVVDKKYYTYEDDSYSITNIPLSDKDLSKLGEAVAFLKQFQGFSHFNELNGMVQKLEDQIYSQKTKTNPVIDFEKNDNLKGLNFLAFFYQAIIKKQAVSICYKSFKAREKSTFVFHCYLLKEFNNRWFVIGRKDKGEAILNLAIDRVISSELAKNYIYKENKNFDAETFYKNAIGVSVHPNMKVEHIEFFASHLHAPYIITKPLHWSQKIIEKNYFGVHFSMNVLHNFELEKKILGFGEGLKIIKPLSLKKIIEKRLNTAVDIYNTDVSNKKLILSKTLLIHKGFGGINSVFTHRSLKKIDSILSRYIKSKNIETHQDYSIENIYDINENIKSLLHSHTYIKLLDSIFSDFSFKKVSFFDYKNSFKSKWKQTKNSLHVIIVLSTFNEDFGGLRFYPGSHRKIISSEKINLLTDISLAQYCSVKKNGVLFFNGQIIHQFFKANTKNRLRFIELVYEKF